MPTSTEGPGDASLENAISFLSDLKSNAQVHFTVLFQCQDTGLVQPPGLSDLREGTHYPDPLLDVLGATAPYLPLPPAPSRVVALGRRDTVTRQ